MGAYLSSVPLGSVNLCRHVFLGDVLHGADKKSKANTFVRSFRWKSTGTDLFETYSYKLTYMAVINCSTTISVGYRQSVLYLCIQLTQFIVKIDLSFCVSVSALIVFFLYFRIPCHERPYVRISGQEQWKFHNAFAFFRTGYCSKIYRSGTVGSKWFVLMDFMRNKWKFELNYAL